MRTGRPLVLLVSLVVACTGVASAASPISEARVQTASSSLAPDQPVVAGFATPEDAIREYLAGVAHADVGRILQACAIDEQAAGWRFDLAVDRFGGMDLISLLAPADYPFFADMNRPEVAARLLRKVRLLVYSLLSTEEIDGAPVSPADEARADAFIKQVDPSRLSSLTVVDLGLSIPTLQRSTRNLAQLARQANIVGADELAEWLVLFSFEGKLYCIGFMLARYGAGWKVFTQSGALAGLSDLGTAQPMTVAMFDFLTSEE